MVVTYLFVVGKIGIKWNDPNPPAIYNSHAINSSDNLRYDAIGRADTALHQVGTSETCLPNTNHVIVRYFYRIVLLFGYAIL